MNANFAPWLTELGLTTAAACLAVTPRDIYRQVGERVTSRHEFSTEAGVQVCYIKRHGQLTWKERWKNWCRLQTPVWGARPEWDAILEFHRCQIPTMTPIACAELNGRSCLITASLENCQRMDHWFEATRTRCSEREIRQQRQLAVRTMARLTRTMHAAGWHHQDLYWCHVLWPQSLSVDQLHIIDLGRVAAHTPGSGRRWIVKDLAQLQFSSQDLTAAEQLRFLREYLERPLTRRDRRLIRRILRKARRIARHTRRHRL